MTKNWQSCLRRQVIAEAVSSDPDTYNAGFLGKSPSDYARWIQDPSKWGGAIELSILSKCAPLSAVMLWYHTSMLFGTDAAVALLHQC